MFCRPYLIFDEGVVIVTRIPADAQIGQRNAGPVKRASRTTSGIPAKSLNSDSDEMPGVFQQGLFT
jgi:hypothetical protein